MPTVRIQEKNYSESIMVLKLKDGNIPPRPWEQRDTQKSRPCHSIQRKSRKAMIWPDAGKKTAGWIRRNTGGWTVPRF